MCLGVSSELPGPGSSPSYYGSENHKKMSAMERPARDTVWERRRRQQVLRGNEKHKRKSFSGDSGSDSEITDDDLSELKACIELGFGFKEEAGQALCNTLPALDLYFAVNRQLSPPSPRSTLVQPNHSLPPSPSHSTTTEPEPWKICSPGEDPEQVKIKLRHWAQAVACSLMQSH